MNYSVLNQLHLAFIDHLEHIGGIDLSVDEVKRVGEKLCDQLSIHVDEDEKAGLISALVDKVLGYGPITGLLNDPGITEIMVNGTESVYIEKEGKLEKLAIAFASNEDLMQVINKIVSPIGRRIDTSNPLVDARLPDGSRVNAIIPPLALLGPVLTIRRFPKNIPTLDFLIGKNTINQTVGDFLHAAIRSRHNIVVSGGTGSGKTTTLNALASLVPKDERVVTIEDSAEMRIDHPHIVALEARSTNLEGKGEITVRQLLKNALRMRPDRIIVGEIRGGEALDMMQAMNTGHPGSLTTVHANSPLEALHRIETMSLMADVELPHRAIREQLAASVNIIVQQQRLPNGTRRVVSVSTVRTILNKDTEYEVVELFTYDHASDQLVATGKQPDTLDLFEMYTVPFETNWFIRI